MSGTLRAVSRLRLIGLIGVLLVLALSAVYVLEPVWYLRMRYPLRYPQTIVTHAKNYDVPPELVAAVIMHESGFDANVRSEAGAVGLMQLTPQTAEGIAERTGGTRFERSDLLDPELNIRYGCWYLAHLHDSFGKGDGRDYVATLAAYNAGQGRVRRWLAEDKDGRLDVDEIPFAETRQYVRRVQAGRRQYGRAYARELGLSQ